MADNFDLLGDPIPANHGGRGRPSHIPTDQNRNRVSMLLAWGWSNERIAAALRVTPPTLRKHYFSELKGRAVARDRVELAVGMKVWEGVQKGSIAAVRQFYATLERNDLMTFGQIRQPAAPAANDAPTEKVPALGKKEAALLAAQQPDRGSTLGDLMARRQQATH